MSDARGMFGAVKPLAGRFDGGRGRWFAGGSNESKEDALGRAVGGGRRTKRRKVGGGGVEGQSAFRLTL